MKISLPFSTHHFLVSFQFMQIHMWDYFNNVKQAALVYSNQTLEEANLQMDQSVSII